MKKSPESPTLIGREKWRIAETMSGEVAVDQQVTLKEGAFKIQTDFINGRARNSAVLAFDAPNGTAEIAMEVINHHRLELRDDILEFKADAERYARIKLRGRESHFLSGKIIEQSFKDYAELYKRLPHNTEDYIEGHEDSSIYPMLSTREKMELFRKVLEYNALDRPIAMKHKLKTMSPKLDAYEHAMLGLQDSVDYTVVIHGDANGAGREEKEGAGNLATLPDPEERSLQQGKFKDFTDKLYHAIDHGNEAWLVAAEAISKGEPLPSEVIKAHAEDIKKLVQAAKKDFAGFEEEIPNSFNGYELRLALEKIEHANNGSEGLYAIIDKVLGMLSDEDLLKSTIEKGLVKGIGKKTPMQEPPEADTEMRSKIWPIAKTIHKSWPSGKKISTKFPADKTINTEVAIEQRATLKEGTYEITTDFINGRVADRDIFKFDAPNGAAENALDAIDCHQSELHDDVKELKADAERYARIKLHGRESPYLSSKLIERAMDGYAFMYTSTPRNKKAFVEGREDCSEFPMIELRGKLDIFRRTLQENQDSKIIRKQHKLKTGLPKPDDIERNILHMKEWLAEVITTHTMANIPVHEEEEGGGLAMLAEPQERPKSKNFREFSRKIIEIIDRCDEAWLLAAEAISKGKKLPSKVLKQQLVEIRTVAGQAKKDLAAFEREFEDHESPNALERKEAVEQIEKINFGEKGLFARLDAILGIMSREELLKSTIEKGMTKERGLS